MPPLKAFWDESGIRKALLPNSTLGVHCLLIGDSKTYGDNAQRFLSGFFRHFGNRTIPFRGCVLPAHSGVTDSYGRSWAGASNQVSVLLNSKPGQDLTASGGSGSFTLFETVTQAVSGATGIFISENGGIVKVWNQGESLPFNGANGITGASSGATRTVSGVANATVITGSIPANQCFKPKLLQIATGNISVSGIIHRGDIEATSPPWGNGEWMANRELNVRGISFGGAGCFNPIKFRAYRNTTSIVQTGNLDLTTPGFFTSELSLGDGSGVPCKGQWQAIGAGDETGQFGFFYGPLFYDPNNKGLSCDYMAVGGGSILAFNDVSYMSNDNFAAYLLASVPDTADIVLFIVDFGQNDAGTSKSDFETNLTNLITRCVNATPVGKIAKFILCAPYWANESAHFLQKEEAVYNVAEENKTIAAFENRRVKFTASYIANNTTDGIHPTLALSETLAQELINNLYSSTTARTKGRGRVH